MVATAKIIDFEPERRRRQILRGAQKALRDGLEAGPSEVHTLSALHRLFGPEARNLSAASSRTAMAMRKIIAVLDRPMVMRSTLDALWRETDIDAIWLCRALGSPRHLDAHSGNDSA